MSVKLTGVWLVKICLLALFITAFASAPLVAGEIEVGQAYARATPPGASSAAVYLLLKNTTGREVTLVKVSSTRAAHAMVHHNQLVGGMMSMRAVSRVPVAAHQQFEFKPGGYHIMLTGLTEALLVGQKIPLRLEFEQGEWLEIEVPVKPVASGNHHHHHMDTKENH